MKPLKTALLLFWLVGCCPILFAADQPSDRLRVLIETDAPGGDPDDEGSLVRFFLYLNEWDVEAIFCTRRADQSRTGENGVQCVHRFINAYEKVYPSLRTHDPRYPTPQYLRSITYPSYERNRARDAVIHAVDRDDPRRLWYVNWGTNDGNLTAMRQALDLVKRQRTPAEYHAFSARLCFSRDADRGYHVRNHIPHLHLWVDTRNPDRWYHRFRPLTESAGGFDIDRDVKNGHGPLGELYTIQKEGDTPGFLYLIPNGLNDVDRPAAGSWAGRFVPRTDEHRREGFFWSDGRDRIGDSINRDNTLGRWAVHIQNDFKARMDWCVSSVDAANHPPAVVVGGVAGRKPLKLTASPKDQVSLSAARTSDPDDDELRYKWFTYQEAGTYGKGVALANASKPEATLVVPEDAVGKTIHVILQVTDTGTPALTRYRRVIVSCRDETAHVVDPKQSRVTVPTTHSMALKPTPIDSFQLWISGTDGVTLATLDSRTGEIASTGLVSSAKLNWMTQATNNLLFAGTTLESQATDTDGAVASFLVANDGLLMPISRVAAQGKSTIYAAAAGEGRMLLATNFRHDSYVSQGSVVAFSVDSDGRIEDCLNRLQHPGRGGSESNRQLASHPHSVVVDPEAEFAAVADLGIDKVFIYRIQDSSTGLQLTSEIAGLAGQQPRHLVWHPSGRFLYCMNEGHATVSVIEFDRQEKTGKFIQHARRISGKGGGGADICVDSAGRFVYGTNRGEDTIVAFAVDSDSGNVRLTGHVPAGGSSTRSIAISPDDRWLVAANQGSDDVKVFSIDHETGTLGSTPHRLSVKQPACALFRITNLELPLEPTK